MLFFMFIFSPPVFSFFFFNDTATTEIYTLSLHDALPICKNFPLSLRGEASHAVALDRSSDALGGTLADRKSTRLNSSHSQISYAVFCLKKKKKKKNLDNEGQSRDTAARMPKTSSRCSKTP